MSLIKRYLTQTEINAIAHEVGEGASLSTNNAVSNMIRTYYDPIRDAGADLYGVQLSNSQIRYAAKLAQIEYVGIIERHKREHPLYSN